MAGPSHQSETGRRVTDEFSRINSFQPRSTGEEICSQTSALVLILWTLRNAHSVSDYIWCSFPVKYRRRLLLLGCVYFCVVKRLEAVSKRNIIREFTLCAETAAYWLSLFIFIFVEWHELAWRTESSSLGYSHSELVRRTLGIIQQSLQIRWGSVTSFHVTHS